MTLKKCGKRKITENVMAKAFSESLNNLAEYHRNPPQRELDGWDAVRVAQMEIADAMLYAAQGLVWNAPGEWLLYTPNPTGQPPPRLGGGSVAPGCSGSE